MVGGKPGKRCDIGVQGEWLITVLETEMLSPNPAELEVTDDLGLFRRRTEPHCCGLRRWELRRWRQHVRMIHSRSLEGKERK